MGVDELERALGLTTLEKAVRWAQTKSMWPDTFGLACCAIEMMSIVSSRYDIARFGMEAFRSSPRQADLLIVSGRVAHKMAAPLRQIYDQMLEPKWVIAMGACASSGGMFNNYTILQGVDRIVPVDIYVPFCPPRPGGADGGDHPPARGAPGRRSPPAYDAQAGGVATVSYDELPGFVEEKEAFGETTVTIERGAHPRRVRARARRARLPRCSSTSSRPTTSAGARRASPATSRPRRPRHQLPVHAGPADAAAAEAEALLRQLPPARAADSRRCACACSAGSTTARTCRASSRVWPTADWHEREQYDLMGITFDGHPNLGAC